MSLFYSYFVRKILIFGKSWQDRLLKLRKMRSRHSIVSLQQISGIWKNSFLGQIWKKRQGVSLVVFFTSKISCPRFASKLQKSSPGSAEESHRVIACLGNFKMSLFYSYFVRKILIFGKSWQDRLLKLRKMRSRHSTVSLQQISGIWKNSFLGQIWKKRQGVSLVVLFTSKISCPRFASKLHKR